MKAIYNMASHKHGVSHKSASNWTGQSPNWQTRSNIRQESALFTRSGTLGEIKHPVWISRDNEKWPGRARKVDAIIASHKFHGGVNRGSSRCVGHKSSIERVWIFIEIVGGFGFWGGCLVSDGCGRKFGFGFEWMWSKRCVGFDGWVV